MAHWINASCTRCGACLTECPTGSIVEGKDRFHIDADTCADHAACVAVCPAEAISKRAGGPARSSADEEEEEEE